jgi:hypothetical protein
MKSMSEIKSKADESQKNPTDKEIETIKRWYDLMVTRNKFEPMGETTALYNKIYNVKNNTPSCNCVVRNWIKRMYQDYGKKEKGSK